MPEVGKPTTWYSLLELYTELFLQSRAGVKNARRMWLRATEETWALTRDLRICAYESSAYCRIIMELWIRKE